MQAASYVFRRSESGIWFFRWNVPTKYRDWFNGKKELKHTLKTDDRKLALRIARKVLGLLEGDILERMRQDMAHKGLPFKDFWAEVVHRMVDGSVRMEGVRVNATTEEERKWLQSWMQTQTTSASATPDSGLNVSGLIAAYLAEGDKAKRWTPKSKQEMEASFALLLEIVGDKPASTLIRKHLSDFKDVVGKLPSNRSKDARYRGKSAFELAGMAIPASDLVSVTTVNKILTRASSLFHWAAINGHVAINIAEGQTIATGKRSDEGRSPYTDEEASKLIQAASLEVVPWRKWLPLLGIYSGARLNELAQLRVEDFKEIEGVPCFEITDEGEGMRLKTANSRRVVPVHPKLVEAGLLKHVEELRLKGVKQFFPELSLSRDGYGKTPSRWFNNFRRKLGIEKDFHSLRHGCAHKLREAGVSEDVAADILGHQRSGRETWGTYAKSASVKRTYPAICKLSY